MDPFNAFNLSPTSMDTASVPATAASRQKSCNACVRGKRRCDKSYPKCTRCAAKGLDCVYHKVPPVRPLRATNNNHTTTTSGNISQHLHTAPAVTVQDSPEDGSGSDHDPHPDFDMDGLDFVGFGSSSSGPHSSSSGSTSATPGTLELDSTGLDFSVVDLLNGADVPGSSIWSLPPFGEPKADFPAPIHMPTLQPRAQVIRRDLSALACKGNEDECLTVDPLLIHDPQSRVGFVLKYITNLHLTFAQTRTLPFLHTRLYRSNLPRTVMSAFCAATTYANRTESTKAWTYNLIAQATTDIQKDGAKAETIMDKLARTQALVIVETIRVFDGDFSLRHSANRDRHILIEWHHELDRLREEMEMELGTPDVASRDHPPPTWDSWILIESLRRTCITVASFLCMVHILESTIPPMEIWKANMLFTASKRLWTADTSVEFYQAWREDPQWYIRDNKFDEFWQYARPEDLDEFTRLLLITQAGHDGVEHFMQGESVPVA
ncbi:unnamed protein product [Clonostachys rosea]|uniref:Zn(2)-C6 fungal-type domain-containing protein n=1 Tax=Bionectria ochroleuca TaxID=29856 RepID=A0ABY6TWT1_BIOOC|nr:unnamed protein product [Clonostachys rosea]